MNYRLCKIKSLMLICLAFSNCGTKQVVLEKAIVVIVPPHASNDTGTAEEKYWRAQKLLFPRINVPNALPPGVPNDHSLLLVTVEKTGRIKINSEIVGDVFTTEQLRLRLKEIFDSRKNLIYEPGSTSKTLAAVAVKASKSLKYEDVMKVITAVKNSGADPIALQIDGLSD
jgi:biopolymer transport protein ExbD